MVELNQAFFRGQLPRGRGPRSGGQTARLPQAPPADTTGQVLGGLARELSRFGQVVGTLNERFRRAQADIQGTEASSELLDRMQARALEIGNDPEVLPMDKAPLFDEEFGQEVERIGEGLPSLARPGFTRATSSFRRQLLRDLGDQGRKETVQRAGKAFAVFQSQMHDALVRSESEIEQAQILEDATAVGAQYVRNGVMSHEDVAAQMQGLQENAAQTRMEILIERDPDTALALLEQGPAENPEIPATRFAALLDKAQDGAQEAFVLSQREERAIREQEERDSRNVRVQHIEQMVLESENIPAIKALMAGARVARQEGRLSAEDAEAVQRFGFKHLDQGTTATTTRTEPEALKQYFRLLIDDPEEAQEYVIDHTGSGLAVGSASGFLNQARQATDERHFRNLRETKDTIAFIEAQLGTTGDPLLDAAVSVDLSSIKADAVTEFLTRLMAVAGDDGLNREAVIQALPAIRDQVTQTHRTRLKAIIEGQPSQTGDPQTQSVKHAVRQWKHMIQQGVPRYEADAFLGRELARHSALAAEGDRLTNAEGVAAALEEALRPGTTPNPPREVIP